jgi:capsid assembly protease
MKTMTQRPMAAYPALLDRYGDLFRYRAGLIPTAAIDAALQAASQRPQMQAGSIAVVPLHGVICRRPGFIEELFGAASLEGFMGTMRGAMASPDISAIVIDIDSPGGEVDGVTEAAAELRAMRGQKPIVAIADTMCASAAYWLASQATEVVASPSGGAGAIGVYTLYDDISGLLEQEGVKRSVISAGKFKEASVGGLELSDVARNQFQDLVDADYGLFVNDVAKGRGVPTSKVRGGYGEGLYLSATAAKAEGMIDRIAPLADVLRSPSLRSGTKSEVGDAGIVAEMDAPPEGAQDTEAEAAARVAAELELLRRRARSHRR